MLRETNAQKKSLQVSVKRKQVELFRASKPRVWSAAVESFAILLFVLTSRIDVPAQYVIWRARRSHPTYTMDTAREEMEELILRTPDKVLTSCILPANAFQERRLNRACHFVVQASLSDWAAHLNNQRGIAPSTDAFIRKHDALVEVYSQLDNRNRYFDASNGGGREFARRWRRIWGGRMGTLRARELLDVESMRTKAFGRRLPPSPGSKKTQMWVHFSVPLWGTQNLALF